jgi:hypothetical protein
MIAAQLAAILLACDEPRGSSRSNRARQWKAGAKRVIERGRGQGKLTDNATPVREAWQHEQGFNGAGSP